MAIFPFKKESSSAKATEDKEKNESLGSKEIESKKPSEQEEMSKFGDKEEEKTKEILENGSFGKEQPSGTIPPASVKTEEQKVSASTVVAKSDVFLEIEQILSENLDNLYASLTPEQKIIFKQKGEETASRVELLMKEVKLNVEKILTVIKEWLLLLSQMVPGVNKIFLIKEAKIKTDKILFFVEERNTKIVKNLDSRSH